MTSKDKKTIAIERIQYSFVPNHTETIEALAMAKFTNEEFRLIMALLRYTNGYLQDETSLSLVKLREVTNISKASLCHNIKRLLQLHVLSRRDKTVYKVNLPRQWHTSLFSLPPKETANESLSDQTTVIGQPANESLANQPTLIVQPDNKSLSNQTTVIGQPANGYWPTSQRLLANQPISSDTKQIGLKDNLKTTIKTPPPISPPMHASSKKKRGVKSHQFLDLVSRGQGVSLLNLGKLIKQVQKCFVVEGTTPERLYECFVWLKQEDVFLKGREPPLIISMLADKYPSWAKGELKGQKHRSTKMSTDDEIERSLK